MALRGPENSGPNGGFMFPHRMWQRAALALGLSCTIVPTAAAFEEPAAGSVSASTLTLPSAPASIRGLADDPSIDVFSGQVTYAVPLDLPHGPGGFAPALSLVYDGALGNGSLGVGWTLPLPSIRRSTRQGVPAYRADDELELVGIAGGGRLVPVGNDAFVVEGGGRALRV